MTSKGVRFDPEAHDDKLVSAAVDAEPFSPCCSTTSSSSSTLAPSSPECKSLRCGTDEPLESLKDVDLKDGYFLNARLSVDAPSFYWDMAKNPIFNLRDTIPWDEPFAVRVINNEPIGGPVFNFRFSKRLEYPWEIQAPASNNEDCSIRDAFCAIYRNLDKLASEEAALKQTVEKRRLIYHARMKRCKDLELDPTKEPLKRIDFLCDSRRFFGVSTAKMPKGCFMIQTGTLIAEGFDD